MTVYELRPSERVNVPADDAGREHLSHSAIGTFLSCQQKHHWQYDEKLTPAVTAAPLALGRAFAHALEKGDPGAGERMLRDDAIGEAARAANNPWIALPDEETVDIQATIVAEAARCYLHRYGQHDQTREVTYRARIRNPIRGGRYSLTHDLLGRVDAMSLDGSVMFEDKLAGQLPRASLAARVKLDRQVSIGCYLAWRCTGVMVDEVRYRVTKKPGIRRRKDESHRDYLLRIAVEYASRPDDYLLEEVATRTEQDFLRLEQELWTWAEQLRTARRTGVYPRNTGACSEFAGCKYLSACAREAGWEHQFVMRTERQEAVAA